MEHAKWLAALPSEGFAFAPDASKSAEGSEGDTKSAAE